jgi:hypothetical protein
MKRINDKIVIDNTPHREEHSLEVQLPFLQMTLKDGFKVVPVLFGSVSLSNCQALAYALSFLLEDNTLIIASTDWSHYYPYDTALKLDRKGINAVVKDDLREYIRSLAEGESEACGAPAVITAMLVAPAMGANKIELLKYANSGDVTGDRSKVVGYAAIAYFRQETKLTEMEKRELLRNARKTIERRLSGKNYLEYKVPEGTLTSNRGAFVTLTKDGKLKGCIGYIQPVKPLGRAVQEMAIEAAENDPRFPPVGKDELKDIKIEISVLSRLKKVKDISEIEIGRDGLYIIKNGKSGLLLPQVAVEWGWDRDRLLDEVCIKAGLREGEWRSKDAVLYRFTADVFHER